MKRRIRRSIVRAGSAASVLRRRWARMRQRHEIRYSPQGRLLAPRGYVVVVRVRRLP